MARRPNQNPSTPPITVVHFLPHERQRLRYNHPAASGKRVGGYGSHENWIINNTDDAGNCRMGPIELDRTIRYCQPTYGPGGPNKRLRETCIPALRRVGISIDPWATPRPGSAARVTSGARGSRGEAAGKIGLP